MPRNPRSDARAARRAMEAKIAEVERLAVHTAMAENANEVAGRPADLDRTLTNAAVKYLVGTELKRS